MRTLQSSALEQYTRVVPAENGPFPILLHKLLLLPSTTSLVPEVSYFSYSHDFLHPSLPTCQLPTNHPLNLQTYQTANLSNYQTANLPTYDPPALRGTRKDHFSSQPTTTREEKRRKKRNSCRQVDADRRQH